MFKKSLLSIALLIFPVGAGYAASVDFAIDDQGRKISQLLEVAGSKVFLRGAGGDSTQDLLFDAEKNVLFVIQHKDKSYLQIDDRVIDEVAALVDSVSGAVENQQGVLSDLLTTFGINAEKQPEVAPMRKTERSLNIAGFPCRLFQAHLNGEMQSEMCIAGNGALQLSAGDFATVRQFFTFGTRLMNRAGKLLSALGMTLPPMELAATDGLPIGMHSPEQKLKVMLSGVNAAALDSSNYRLPAGYTRSSIPFTSG